MLTTIITTKEHLDNIELTIKTSFPFMFMFYDAICFLADQLETYINVINMYNPNCDSFRITETYYNEQLKLINKIKEIIEKRKIPFGQELKKLVCDSL